MVKGIIRNLFDLGFYPDPTRSVYLGGELSWKHIAWDIVSWLSLSFGIFLRQGLVLAERLDWTLERLSWGVFLASVVVGLAVFRVFMKWFNRHRPKPGLVHIASPFAFGFFLNLAALSLFRIAKIVSG
jgi:hypothetical protein